MTGHATSADVRTRPRDPRDAGPLSILVAIANHGTKNDRYAARLLDEYRSMTHIVEIVVLSDAEKDWGDDVEVRVGCPTSDPWSLPFAHKPLFAERVEDFDLFVYTEDDTLLTEASIEAFLSATRVLPDDLVAGFLRQERGPEGRRYVSTAHSYYHWDPASVLTWGDRTFAHFTNDHGACYVLTRDQLRRAIASGGFLVEPHDERYDLLVTAATDPYTQCGLRKVVCISHLDDFVLEHLPSAYVGQLGLDRTEFARQIAALEEIECGERTVAELVRTETRARHARWSKHYYEPEDRELLEALGTSPCRVLSVGCGWGATEAAAADAGHEVVAVPLDAVIGACAEARGLEVVCGTVSETAGELAGRAFDAILISNLLHLVECPDDLLRAYSGLLIPGGRWIVRTPSFAYLPTVWRRLRRARGFRDLGAHARSGLHPVTPGAVRRWLRSCGARRSTVRPLVNARLQRWSRWTAGLFAERLAPSVVVVARQGD